MKKSAYIYFLRMVSISLILTIFTVITPNFKKAFASSMFSTNLSHSGVSKTITIKFKAPLGTNSINPIIISVDSPHTSVTSAQSTYSSSGNHTKTVTVPYYSQYKVTFSQDRGYTNESEYITVAPPTISNTVVHTFTQGDVNYALASGYVLDMGLVAGGVATGGLIGLTFTGAGVIKTTCDTFGGPAVTLPNGLSITKPRIGWKIQTIVTYSNYTAKEYIKVWDNTGKYQGQALASTMGLFRF